MNRREILGVGAAVGIPALLAPTLAAVANPQADAMAVRALLDQHVAAWTAGDAKLMFAAATDDIHWVNVVGMHWQGKSDVERAHEVYFTTIFRGVSMALEEVESIA